MNQKYILYNPIAGNGTCREDARVLAVLYDNTQYCDITEINDWTSFFQALDASDEVILCGGDGTLNRFANDIKDVPVSNRIYYFALGNGNDFIRDLDLPKNADPDFRINDYLRNLPEVTVHGQKFLFLNNVGFGIDGYCCEVADRLREESRQKGKKKTINYTWIAIKGVLFRFKPRNAVVTVDGVSHTFKKVWLAPTMHGRYYGGGMMAAPEQDRLSKDRTLSIMVMHSAGQLRTLLIFPTIFTGKHVQRKKQVSVLTGHEITVAFDRPTPLQIDGETILDVSVYEAKSSMRLFAEKEADHGRKKETI